MKSKKFRHYEIKFSWEWALCVHPWNSNPKLGRGRVRLLDLGFWTVIIYEQ